MRKFLAQENEHDEPFAFLGGTVNGSNWRDLLIPMLKVAFFNPVVTNWTPEDVVRENQAKAASSLLVYLITPKQHGYYVVVEAAIAACTSLRKKVIITFIAEDGGDVFDEHQIASNEAIKELLLVNPMVEFYNTIEDTANAINRLLPSNHGI